MLELRIQLPDAPAYINKPIPVKVTLLNNGQSNVLVNTRLAVGYKHSVSRELYAFLKNTDTEKAAVYSANDINRDFAVLSNYKSLGPGESVSTTFNLLEYYPLKKSGNYELTLYYEADEKLARTPTGVWKGVISCGPTRFKILSGKQFNDH